MNFISCLIAPVGMGILGVVVPLLSVTPLVFSAIHGKLVGFMLNLLYFFGYFYWLGFGLILLFELSEDVFRRNILLLMLWPLPGSIPHALILFHTIKTKNCKSSIVGLLGVSTTMLATIGIWLMFYSARFF